MVRVSALMVIGMVCASSLALSACRNPAPQASASDATRVTLDEPEPPPRPALRVPDAAPPQAQDAVVTGSSGKVETLRPPSATWRDLAVGDRLATTDSVRTAEGAEVDLQVNDMKVKVYERSELTVKTMQATAFRATLVGRLESDLPEGKGTIEIEAVGSDAVVRSTGGRFSMTSSGRGVVAVASVEGTVNLTAHGAAVDVVAGQESLALPGAAPRAPHAALTAVLLAVQWPDVRETNKPTLPVAGHAEPGGRVVVQGHPVELDSSGGFHVDVPLRPGTQRIVVLVEDPFGRTRRAETSVLYDSTLPDVKVQGQLWH